MKLTEISAGQTLSGVELNQIVTVVATVPHSDTALQLIYRVPDGSIPLMTHSGHLAQRRGRELR